MYIHTYMVATKLKKESNSKSINILAPGADLFEYLSIADKILILLSSKNVLSTKKLYSLLSCNNRGIRNALATLEAAGRVRRTKGISLNNSFRKSDSWLLASKSNIFQKIPSDMIGIHHKTHHSNNGFKQHLLLLPLVLDLSDFASIAGLFDAEGSKTKPRTIEFTNSEPELINQFLKVFTYLGVPIKDWSWRIIFKKSMQIPESNLQERASKRVWIEACRLNPQKYNKIQYIGKVSSKSLKSKDWGTVSISLHNSLLTRFFFTLLKSIKPKILSSKKFSKVYLDGFFSGEACVCTRQLQVASANNLFLKYIQTCLTKVGIPSSFSKQTSTAPKRILVNRFENLLALRNIIFTGEPYKKRRLLASLLGYKKINEFNRKLILNEFSSVDLFLKHREMRFNKFYNS